MKKKDKILNIIEEANCPICDDCITSKGLINKRQQVNSILNNETKIIRKKGTCSVCKKNKLINCLIEHITNSDTPLVTINKNSIIEKQEYGNFSIAFNYCWVSLLEDEGLNYLFPKPLSKAMKKHYAKPAIYRWILINEEGNKLQEVYLGEAQELGKRIYHYLKPGKRQMTNNRLNKLFSNLIEDGYTITIQKLDFEPFKLGIYEISDDSLNKKLVRRFIEHMMASYYTVAGYKMLNA